VASTTERTHATAAGNVRLLIALTGLVLAVGLALLCGFIHLAYVSGRQEGGAAVWGWSTVDIVLALMPVAAGISAFAFSGRSTAAKIASAAGWMGGLACLGLLIAVFLI
jgi:hypothetical protein